MLGAIGGIAAINAIIPRPNVSPYGSGFVSVNKWDEGFILALGTKVSTPAEYLLPIQTSYFSCIKEREYCHVATAWINEFNTLDVAIDYYKIETWTADLVVLHDGVGCRQKTYTITRATQKIAGRTDAQGDCGKVNTVSYDLETGYEVVRRTDKIKYERNAEARDWAYLIWAGIFGVIFAFSRKVRGKE